MHEHSVMDDRELPGERRVGTVQRESNAAHEFFILRGTSRLEDERLSRLVFRKGTYQVVGHPALKLVFMERDGRLARH